MTKSKEGRKYKNQNNFCCVCQVLKKILLENFALMI